MSSTPLRLAFAALAMTCLCGIATAQVHDVACGTAVPNVQTALTNAADGDIIVVHPCTVPPFQYPAFVVSGRANIQIVGADLASFIVSAFPIGVNSTGPNAPALIRSSVSTCARIENSVNISLVGLLFEDCGEHGIEVFQSRRINVHGNSLSYADKDGVKIEASSFVDVTGNHLQNAQRFGVSTDTSSRFVQIEANRLLYNRTGVSMEGDAIDVVNNEVRLSLDEGIVIRSRNSKVSRNWSVGNATSQINFANWNLPDDNCVVGNFLGGAGLTPVISQNGCQSENF